MRALKKLIDSTKGAVNMTGIIVDVVLVTALIPVIAGFIAGAGNLTAIETTILSLATLFIVLGLVFTIGKQTGLIKSK